MAHIIRNNSCGYSKEIRNKPFYKQQIWNSCTITFTSRTGCHIHCKSSRVIPIVEYGGNAYPPIRDVLPILLFCLDDHDNKDGRTVLLTSTLGISRSATVAIAYYMWNKKVSLKVSSEGTQNTAIMSLGIIKGNWDRIQRGGVTRRHKQKWAQLFIIRLQYFVKRVRLEAVCFSSSHGSSHG